jgi:hypothetical protein
LDVVYEKATTMTETITETFIQYVETVENEVKASGYKLGRDIILYRGISSADWKLLPSIAWKKEKRRVSEKGFATLEDEVLGDFRKRSFPFLEAVPQTPLEWLTLAQHHGLPTRLLDWSCNALAALWFTVNENATAGGAPRSEGYGAIWIFRTEQDDWMGPEEEQDMVAIRPEKLRVYMPKSVTSRVTAQLGFFTIHPDNNGSFQPLEEHQAYQGRLKKILIPHHTFPHFREALDRMGINRFSIFPDLDGLAHHIRWYHFREDDEL